MSPKGVPLTEYCDKNHLSAQDRLKLFINVCHAIQHAHQKGVIHRDVKPTNIMVTLHDGKPVPKVIDFGVSKALSLQLTEKTLFTAYGQMMGTPAYMSPEQVEMSGLDIDTRSDIYSLGVLLYELLTGGTPFDAKRLGSAGFVEMQRIIREEDPPKPSTRLTTMDEDATIVSENRSTVPKKLGELIRGDLDWIVMKALEKERDRRYETANEFAADIERFLNDEPVTAYPPSTAYKFFKFVRRNKKTILTSVTLAVVLVLGTVVSTWQAFHATESKRVAKAEAAISTAVIDFINRDLLAQADPFREPDRDLTVRQALDRASKKIKGRFQQQPLVEAAIRQTIGTTYLTLGEYGKAERHLKRAVKIRRRLLGTEHKKTIVSMMNLAVTIRELGRYAEAEKLQTNVLEIQRRVLGAKHPDTLYSMNALAWFLSVSAPPEQRSPEEAVGLSKETLSHQPDNGKYLRTLGQALYRAGDLHDAIQALNKSIEFRGPNQHDYLMLTLVHWHLGHKDPARMLFEKTNGRKLHSKHLQQLHAEMATLLESENAPLRTGNTKD